jgi:glycosyltransferase involved in cell wall biosynthesis
MKVLLLSRHTRLGASSRVRSIQFIPGLRAYGIEVDAAPLLNDEYLVRLYTGQRRRLTPIAAEFGRRMWRLFRGGYDLVWVEKEAFPWLPAVAERALRVSGTPYVVDYDDATFHDYDRHPRWMVRRLLGGKIAKVMQRAATVTAGNQYISDYATRVKARRVVIMPSVVDVDRYRARDAVDEGKIRLGWIGTPKTQQFLGQIGEALQSASAQVPLELIAIGARNAEIPGVSVLTKPWTEASEAAELSAVDIGIMPLADTDYVRGKCGYKLIQYMASGLPTIAFPSQANSSIVDNNLTGILAKSQAEWVTAIVRLARDRNLRSDMGAAGRAKAESQYSIKVMLPQVAEVLSEAIAR